MNDSVRPILVVEDRAIDLDLTKRAFERRQIPNPILEARDGEEALAYFQKWDAGETLPLFILLDVRLPRINGLEVLKRLKNHPKYCSIPVIMLSTSNEDRDISEAYKLGCNSYIVKPVEFEQFMQVATQIETYWCALNTSSRLGPEDGQDRSRSRQQKQ